VLSEPIYVVVKMADLCYKRQKYRDLPGIWRYKKPVLRGKTGIGKDPDVETGSSTLEVSFQEVEEL